MSIRDERKETHAYTTRMVSRIAHSSTRKPSSACVAGQRTACGSSTSGENAFSPALQVVAASKRPRTWGLLKTSSLGKRSSWRSTSSRTRAAVCSFTSSYFDLLCATKVDEQLYLKRIYSCRGQPSEVKRKAVRAKPAGHDTLCASRADNLASVRVCWQPVQCSTVACSMPSKASREQR